ncbi:hypothetical protein F5B22DRAFT_116472 [Xylaria bambusicola]|uniref:uncharacterized protein n=1 Tax=Xylaria bambusicola TaxID=326684 RepID=UPI00200721B2|nr:uncharacterized protein F5B22DRAFT_116472 [Xylaria bambusicola]KAI0517305.1 hypothetical protein F5B22DRAFT_116472 [Xylaria bambusicola]
MGIMRQATARSQASQCAKLHQPHGVSSHSILSPLRSAIIIVNLQQIDAYQLARAMFPTLVRRLATSPPSAPKLGNIVNARFSEYKPKKVWPPDFSKLSKKEQFRFEKRYKRRIRLATARPRWNKLVQLAQLGTVTFVVVYSILFMEWNSETQPFQGVRNTFWNAIGALSSEKRHVGETSDLPATANQKS